MISGSCGKNLTWTLDDEGTLTISGTGDMDNYSFKIHSPWYDKHNSIKSVFIENGVTSIGAWALNLCVMLESITLPDSVTYIGNNAFRFCRSLTSITLPDSVNSIGTGVFSCCGSLKIITIPNSITQIGAGAFWSCKSLTSITFPDSVTRIRYDTFSHCSSLKKIIIPDSITYIGRNAFSCCSLLTSITIPEGVTVIRVLAFSECTSLTSVTIPKGVTTIGSRAFSGCKGLKEIHYPSGRGFENILSQGNNAELIPYDEFPPDITEKEPDKPKDTVENISPPAEEVSKVDSNPTIIREENFAVYKNTKYDRTESFAPNYSRNWSNVDDKTVAIRKAAELAAMNIVMNIERNLGFVPVDVSSQNLGYDIKSTSPDGKISRLIEVKGRYIDAESVTVSRNEVIAALNNPDNFILAIVKLDADKNETIYLKSPFEQPPDKAALSINFSIQKLIEAAKIISR